LRLWLFCTPDFRELSKIFLNFLDFRAQQQNTTLKTVFFTPNRDGLGSGANVPGINKRTLFTGIPTQKHSAHSITRRCAHQSTVYDPCGPSLGDKESVRVGAEPAEK